MPEEDRGAAFDEVVAWAAGLDGVANAQVVGINEEGTGAHGARSRPATGPEDTATEDLLTELRDGQADIEAADRYDDRRHRPDRHHDRRVRAAQRRAARSTSPSSSGWRSCC